jgi:hypothetical protein
MEWSPPVNLGWQMNLFFAWLLLFILLAAHSTRKLSALEWTWLLGFGWLALSGQRYVIWFVFILAFLTARLLAEWGFKWIDRPIRAGIPALDFSLGLIFLLMPLALLPGLRDGWWAQAPDALFNTPVQSVQWLAENPTIPGPIWTEVGFASYLEYSLPVRPVWIDTRFELYPTEQWQRYQAINKAAWNWQEILDEEGINLLMISKINQKDLLTALRASPTWVEIHADETAVIYKRVDGK